MKSTLHSVWVVENIRVRLVTRKAFQLKKGIWKTLYCLPNFPNTKSQKHTAYITLSIIFATYKFSPHLSTNLPVAWPTNQPTHHYLSISTHRPPPLPPSQLLLPSTTTAYLPLLVYYTYLYTSSLATCTPPPPTNLLITTPTFITIIAYFTNHYLSNPNPKI